METPTLLVILKLLYEYICLNLLLYYQVQNVSTSRFASSSLKVWQHPANLNNTENRLNSVLEKKSNFLIT